MRTLGQSMVHDMEGVRPQRKKLFGGIILVIMGWYVLSPVMAKADDLSIKRFVRSYRIAWSAPTPLPLLNLAVTPGIFTDLAALDRWDFLDGSVVDVELLRYGRTSGSEITVELLRRQRDRFVQGTYSSGEVRERLVLSPWRGELRIKRFLGAVSAVRRSSMPRTWASERHSEKLLMKALEALAIHDAEDCLDNVYELFKRNGLSEALAIDLPEPFKDRKTALSNAYFVRAACTRIALEETHHNEADEYVIAVQKRRNPGSVQADLDRALVADPDHRLARLLRARILLEKLGSSPEDRRLKELKQARNDLKVVMQHTPDLEDVRSLSAWAALLNDVACGNSNQLRCELPPFLLTMSDLLPAEALEQFEKSKLAKGKGLAMNSLGLELSLLVGDTRAAERYLKALEEECPSCAQALYLKARWAEQQGRPFDAMEHYEQLLVREPGHRDAAWRYAELGMGTDAAQWEMVVQRLLVIAKQLPERDAVALKLLISVTNSREPGIKSLLRTAKMRFGDKPLPSAVRRALVRALGGG